MRAELLKIIEGGLSKDLKKVVTYTKLLAENLTKEGDVKSAERVLKVLGSGSLNPVQLDQLLSAPVDQETRMNIVDLIHPQPSARIEHILSETLRSKLDAFINRLQHRYELQEAGVDSIASLLLYGPPGCGKTTLAHYIAQRMGLPLVVARLDSLVSSLLGSTSKNIRKVFEFAGRQPCILFLDEFDAIAKARDDQHELGELKRVVNSLLQNIDDFTKSNILIAATNHQELLDKAIWRRFNSIVEVGLPSEKEIRELIQLYLAKGKGNVDFEANSKKWDSVIELLKGLSPADIRAICHNTLAHGIMNHKASVSYSDFLLQYHYFKQHNSSSPKELVEFLKKYDVGQRTIAELSGLSERQVRNIINL